MGAGGSTNTTSEKTCAERTIPRSKFLPFFYRQHPAKMPFDPSACGISPSKQRGKGGSNPSHLLEKPFGIRCLIPQISGHKKPGNG